MLLAILVPGVWFLMHRRPQRGLLLLLLQPTIIGWIVGAILAVQARKRQHRRFRAHNHPPPSVGIITPKQWETVEYGPKRRRKGLSNPFHS